MYVLDHHYRESLLVSLDKIDDLIKSKQKKRIFIDTW